jgi:PhnB protein
MTAPAGWHTLTPRLFVQDPARLIEFLQRAFGAQGELENGRPSQLRIGDSILMISEAAHGRTATQSCFYLYVEDADAAYERALSAGATSLEVPTDTPYGDRRAIVADSFSNSWQIATVLRTGT